ncbi:hypothetical protein Q5P01_015204 [Channa striata]|uniref:Ciliary neurotrophic factor n=1 Tax=Channa striata TaxID=64152 RepID=A0AA88MK65_CHASR|nr:hypothetical protein Q5P01_015204 [Channa striata]
MDHKLKGLLTHSVEAGGFGSLHGPNRCKELDNVKNNSGVLKDEAELLLKEYERIHSVESQNGSVPGYVDDFNVTGASVSEKLQSLYNKFVLFHLHMLKVEEYQVIWDINVSEIKPWSQVKGELQLLSNAIKHILKWMYPESPLPPTLAPLQVSHSHDYAKKEYGWNVIATLKDWQQEVVWVIDEAQQVCHQRSLTAKRKSHSS